MSTTSEQTGQFDQWAILEIMGHQRFAGHLTEQTIGGAAMLRIDVPAVGDLPAFTRYFTAASVYAITPVSEELARQVASGLKRAPVTVYELPEELREKLRRPVAAITDRSSGAHDNVSDWVNDPEDDEDGPF